MLNGGRDMNLTKNQIKMTKGVAILFMLLLHLFCTKSYEENRDFYEQFYERLEEAKKLLSLGV